MPVLRCLILNQKIQKHIATLAKILVGPWPSRALGACLLCLSVNPPLDGKDFEKVKNLLRQPLLRAGPQRRGGGQAKGGRLPRASYSEGPHIVRALFLRIPQNALKALIPNETLFGAKAIF